MAESLPRPLPESAAAGVDRVGQEPLVLRQEAADWPLASSVRSVRVYQSTAGAHWAATVQHGRACTTYGDWPLNITATNSVAESGDGAVIGDPNTTVDGDPARTSTGLDGGSGLQLYNVNGSTSRC